MELAQDDYCVDPEVVNGREDLVIGAPIAFAGAPLPTPELDNKAAEVEGIDAA